MRSLWDSVINMPVQGDGTLYPNNQEPQPALMEVWTKAGDFWRAGFRQGDELACDQNGLPLRQWMIRAIHTAKGEAPEKKGELYNFTAIDFETATNSRASVCEVGIAVVKDGIVTETKSWMIQPPGNTYEQRNIHLHHITPDDTKNSPVFSDVWPEILPYLEEHLVVAHNTAFDMYVLRDTLEELHLPYPTFRHICSCRLAKGLFPGLYNYRLETVSETVGFHMDSHHRAGIDAQAAAVVFTACVDKSKAQSIAELEERYTFNCGSFSDGQFLPQKAKYSGNSGRVSAKDIFGNPDLIDEGNYFYGKVVCFTGTCSYGTRANMFQRVADIGGIPTDKINGQTQVLVVGQQDYRVVGSDGMSNKQRKAIELCKKGQDIEILSEAEFLQMI
ncbi:MAG: 3'-5' exoribonuclease [Prevotella sp.]|nr:3'-5' exoribonuclease [Prevotella sp.]